MPRLSRPDYENTYHHVIVRGVDGLPIFDTAAKKNKYIKILREARESHDISIYAICFVDSHVHFFLRRNKQSMGIFFRRVNGQYGTWYNKRFKRTGALYDARYYSTLVDADAYFNAVWRYVHYQNVEAGLYELAEEDPWSSAKIYLGHESPLSWIDWEEAVQKLGVGTEEALKKVLDAKGKETEWYGKENFPYELYRGQKFLAGEAFIEKYMQIRKSEVRQQPREREETPISWENLLKFARKLSGFSVEKLLEPSKSPERVRHRDGLAYAGRKYGHLTVSELADKLGVTSSTVSKMIQRLTDQDETLKNKWDERFEGEK